MKEWRLIRSGPLPGALNMALDEALLEAVGSGRSMPVLRLYRWRPAAVTLGYAQPAAEIDFTACRELGLDVVRRPTGGRAVLHDREATYAVIAPESSFPVDVLESYRVIALALRRALLSLGIPAELAPGRQRPAAAKGDGICFLAPSSWELVCRGCKVAGSSQKRTHGAFLQHGSLPVEMDLARLSRILAPDSRRGGSIGTERLAQSIGWLNRWRTRPVAVETVEEALVAAFAGEWNLEFQADQPTAGEWARAQDLAARKYANPAWLMDPALASGHQVISPAPVS